MIVLRFVLVVSALFSVSCLGGWKSRVSQLQEGMNVPIKDIVNLKCLLETGDRKDTQIPFTDALSFNLERKKKKGSYVPAEEETLTYKYQDPKDEKIKTGWLNNFNYVVPGDLKEDSPAYAGREVSCENFNALLKHPFLRAKSNHSYNVRFQVAGGFVRVLLLAPPKDIPQSALAYSLKLRKNLYAMPIGGYKAPSVEMEAVKNSNWEKTNITIGKPLPMTQQVGFEERISKNGIRHSYLKGTSYVKFTSADFIPYKSLVEESGKIDVYPKNFFQGEWFYAVTPVTASSKGILGGGVGQHYFFSGDSEGKDAHAVRFDFKKKWLVAYNVNKELSDKSDDGVSFSDRNRWVFQIPLEHLDYISAKSGPYRNVGLKEVTNKDNRYQLKPLAGLDFNNVKMVIQERAPFLNSKAGYLLEELTFSSDYFSFLLKDQTTNRTMRFSLLKKPEGGSSYSSVYLTEDMFNFFPSFKTSRRIRMADHLLRNREFSQRFPVQRFHITTEEPVRYHFSNLTPKDDSVRRIGRESVNIWNQVFTQAGVSCPRQGCFVLDKTQDVPLGDIRYNVFNFIDPKEDIGPGYGGLGPSMSDYETGEIISATTNVNTTNIRLNIIYNIYEYIQRETGLSSSLFRKGIQRQQSSTAGYRLSLWTGLFREKIEIPNYILSFFQDFRTGFSLTEGYTTIYGFQQNDESKPPELITSLEEAVSPKEKEHLLLSYRIATGKEPPQDLEEVYKELEEFDQENNEGLLHHSCQLQEERFGAGGEQLMGERLYSLIDSLCGDSLSVIPRLQEKNAGTLSPHLQRELLDTEIRQTGPEDRVSAVEREIYECASKILPLISIGITLHEQGHNISMRHNFAGSSDKPNFLKNEDFSHDFILSHLSDEETTQVLDIMKPDSSTVMDYLHDEVISPGAYDVAFTRFYYGGKIETNNGDIVEVDFTDPIDRHSLKPYRSCEDTVGRKIFGKDDIFCNPFDKGTTVSELVDNYRNFYITQPLTFSYNRILPRGRLGVLPFYLYTLGIYHKWRRVLADSLDMNISESPLLLSGLQPEKYKEKIYSKIMTGHCTDQQDKHKDKCICTPEALNSEEANKELRELYCAKMKITETFRDVLFLIPDHYCIAENSVEHSELIAFSDIHAKLTKSDRFLQDMSSCANVKEALEGEFKEEFEKSGWKLTGAEVGYPLFSGRFSTDKTEVSLDYAFDYRGIISERFFSGFVFFFSTYLKKIGRNSLESIIPISFMDEPDIRAAIKAFLIDRITKGINKASLIPKEYLEDGNNEQVHLADGYFRLEVEGNYYYNFRSEELLWSLLSMPLLSAFGPIPNIAVSLQNLLASLGVVVPIQRVHNNWDLESVAAKFLVFLDLKYSHNAHIYTGDKYKKPIVILPRGPYIHEITNSLNEIELHSKVEDFSHRFIDWQRNDMAEPFPEPSESIFEFINSRKNFIQRQIIQPVFELFGAASQEISNETYFTLTYSVLFDYLIRGTKTKQEEPEKQVESAGLEGLRTKTDPKQNTVKAREYFVTDYLVEVLQSALVMEYKSKKAFKKESPDISDREFGKVFQLPFDFDLEELAEQLLLPFDLAPPFEKRILKEMEPFSHLPFEEYLTGILHTEPKGTIAFNLFHPYFEYLVQCVAADKEILNEEDFRHLIVTLFKLEAFKPGYFYTSQISAGLKDILDDIFVMQVDENKKITIRAIIDSAEKEVEWIKEKLKQLRVLKFFERDQFLRDIMFQPFFAENNKMKSIIEQLILFLDLFDTKAIQPFAGLRDISFNAMRDSFLKMKFQMSRKSISHKIIPFYANFINGLIMKIQIDAGWEALKGSERMLLENSDKLFGQKNVNFYNIATQIFNKERGQSTKGEFVDLFTNSMQKEIRSQEDILLRSIRPYVVIERNSDSGESGSVAATAHQTVFEFSQKANERYKLKRSANFK